MNKLRIVIAMFAVPLLIGYASIFIHESVHLGYSIIQGRQINGISVLSPIGGCFQFDFSSKYALRCPDLENKGEVGLAFTEVPLISEILAYSIQILFVFFGSFLIFKKIKEDVNYAN